MISDGKSKPELARLQLTMEVITLQRPEPVMVPAVSPTAVLLSNQLSQQAPIESKERMVQITRDKEGGLGLSIKGGAEHKLPILISRIYKNHAADRTGALFVGDAIIKVNGEYITACNHDDAVNILRNAGDIVVLTVKHYRAATPFLQKQCKLKLRCVLCGEIFFTIILNRVMLYRIVVLYSVFSVDAAECWADSNQLTWTSFSQFFIFLLMSSVVCCSIETCWESSRVLLWRWKQHIILTTPVRGKTFR